MSAPVVSESDLRLGALAVRHGLLTQQALDETLKEQEKHRIAGEFLPLGELLLKTGRLAGSQLEHLLRLQDEAWANQRTLGKYKLLEKIGQGGMGAVWKAVHKDLGGTVAVKLLPRQVAGNESLVLRFQQEARLMASINHTNILQAFDYGDEQGQPYFVMPFLEGASLGDLLEKTGRLGVRTACSIALQVVRGLNYAHQRGMIHRDLKPDNLFVVHDGTVKILDLGLAKLMEDAAVTGKRPTLPGMVVGTPHFMAPEQILGDPNLDHRADLYSLGTTLYQMLTGRMPFDGNVHEILRAKLDLPPPDPAQFNPGISTGVRRMILKLLAAKASERFKDCAEVEAELETLLEGQPVTGPHLSPGQIAMGLSEKPVRITRAEIAPPPKPAVMQKVETPKGGVGLFGQIVAAIFLILITVAITLAVVEFRMSQQRRPAPATSGH